MNISLKDEEVIFSFVAMEYYWLILNRSYKIFVTNKHIIGVRIRGVMAASPKHAVDPEWKNPDKYVPSNIEEKYSEDNFTTDKILAIDDKNFVLERASVSDITFDSSDKWGMGHVPHSGKIFISNNKDIVREFILLGKQEGNDIRELLSY